MFDERFFKKKKFFCSSKLNRPEILREKKEVNDFLDFFDPKVMNPCVEKEFYSTHTGLSKYTLYTIDQKEE